MDRVDGHQQIADTFQAQEQNATDRSATSLAPSHFQRRGKDVGDPGERALTGVVYLQVFEHSAATARLFRKPLYLPLAEAASRLASCRQRLPRHPSRPSRIIG